MLFLNICGLPFKFEGFLKNFEYSVYNLFNTKAEWPVAVFEIYPPRKYTFRAWDKPDLIFSSLRWNILRNVNCKIFEINFSELTKESALVIKLEKKRIPYRVKVYYLKNVSHDPLLFFGGNLLFSELLPEFEGLLLHGSAVSYTNGEAIIFTGPSGSGKTTFANIASRNGLKKISDDLVAIRMFEKKLYLYPLPWMATPDLEYENKPYPVKKIFILNSTSSKKDSLKMLSPLKSFKLLLPRCYLPYWDKDILDKSLSIMAKLVQLGLCYKFNFVRDIKSSYRYFKSYLS